MPTLDETVALLRSLKLREESWPEFVRLYGIKSYTSTQLERIEAGDFKKGPFQFKLDALYDELRACHPQGKAKSGPSQTTRPPPGGTEGPRMDQRRTRLVGILATYLEDISDDHALSVVFDGMVEGAIHARRSLQRPHGPPGQAPPGQHKVR